MGTHGVSTFLINSKFASGNLVFYEKTVGRTATGDVFTVGTAAVKVGGTAQDVDFQVYGTGSLSAIIDIGAATLTLTGIASNFLSAVNFGVDATGVDVTFFGDTTLYKAWFDQNGDTNGAFYFGADDYGIDVGFYGQTITNSMVWDASANALVFVAGGITMGTGSTLILPVRASGTTTKGDIWYDTTDDYIHFYDNLAEVIITGCINA